MWGSWVQRGKVGELEVGFEVERAVSMAASTPWIQRGWQLVDVAAGWSLWCELCCWQCSMHTK
jgi:hypothetical protein